MVDAAGESVHGEGGVHPVLEPEGAQQPPAPGLLLRQALPALGPRRRRVLHPRLRGEAGLPHPRLLRGGVAALPLDPRGILVGIVLFRRWRRLRGAIQELRERQLQQLRKQRRRRRRPVRGVLEREERPRRLVQALRQGLAGVERLLHQLRGGGQRRDVQLQLVHHRRHRWCRGVR
uniref:Uncharacterized protein n=1 Tax=Setaria viridis TaxID=4556 RepID=A0A4U6W3M8_SETVI|nr:hypothetical protein SEVIR_1G025600v2 [Setaria viridis]